MEAVQQMVHPTKTHPQDLVTLPHQRNLQEIGTSIINRVFVRQSIGIREQLETKEVETCVWASCRMAGR